MSNIGLMIMLQGSSDIKLAESLTHAIIKEKDPRLLDHSDTGDMVMTERQIFDNLARGDSMTNYNTQGLADDWNKNQRRFNEWKTNNAGALTGSTGEDYVNFRRSSDPKWGKKLDLDRVRKLKQNPNAQRRYNEHMAGKPVQKKTNWANIATNPLALGAASFLMPDGPMGTVGKRLMQVVSLGRMGYSAYKALKANKGMIDSNLVKLFGNEMIAPFKDIGKGISALAAKVK